MRKRSHGFTLIELLVVIAIIAILAAILFPIFASAKESATKAACANYLSQLGKAQLMYRDEYGDRLPLHFGWLSGQSWAGCAGDHCSYYLLLRKYTRTKTGSFQCPKTTYPPKYITKNNQQVRLEVPGNYPNWASGIWVITGDRAAYLKQRFGYTWLDEFSVTSYAAFFYPRNAGAARKDWDCFVVSGKYRRPSKIIYLFESTTDFCTADSQLQYPAEKGGYLAPRHSADDLAALLFFDGHVEMRSRQYIHDNAAQLLGYSEPG